MNTSNIIDCLIGKDGTFQMCLPSNQIETITYSGGSCMILDEPFRVYGEIESSLLYSRCKTHHFAIINGIFYNINTNIQYILKGRTFIITDDSIFVDKKLFIKY